MDKERMGWIILIPALLLMIPGLIITEGSFGYMVFYFFLLLLALYLVIVGGRERARKKINDQETAWRRTSSQENVPNQAKTMIVNKISNSSFSSPRTARIWINNETLHMVIYGEINDPSWKLTKRIHLNDIVYFFNSGDFYTENIIKGGGGGGTSLSGALVGGVLFGDAGAILGSRKKIDSITSELLVHDTRETILKFTENHEEEFIHFKLDEMRVLYGLLPKKSFEYVMAKDQKKSQMPETKREDITERLRKLKEMKEEGFLNEEEFESKRKELIQSF